ncbi:hypothetical protein AB0M57_14195 [Streptomyces sp. NPDC051597]|uniref:hypothetical protein n=1 Tax=Streptomyces sp. NPDC051597 TaxID=3155049 RepID=UPI00342C2878
MNSVPARGSTPRDDGTVGGYLYDGRSSWATLTQAGSGVADAAQQGPRRLAEEAMRALHLWAQHGEPSVYDFGMTVRPDGQWIWCGSPDSDPYVPCDQ